MSQELPPPVQGPTAKEKKYAAPSTSSSEYLWMVANSYRYDRQLRLWGATGQMALEESHILLINSGPGVVGLETLKNLVLPGIGNFTIQDSATVSHADLGVNFFLEEEHVGGYRAEHTCNLLKELNPDVQGHYITEVRSIHHGFCQCTYPSCSQSSRSLHNPVPSSRLR